MISLKKVQVFISFPKIQKWYEISPYQIFFLFVKLKTLIAFLSSVVLNELIESMFLKQRIINTCLIKI